MRYQIREEEAPNYFQLIFFEWSCAVVDVCFTPDSRSVVAIPAKFPAYVIVARLSLRSGNALAAPPSLTPQFNARAVGPWLVAGPALPDARTPDARTPVVLTHVAAAPHPQWPVTLVTWNDEGRGEFCVWTLHFSSENQLSHFQWKLLQVNPLLDQRALEVDSDYPKNFILNAVFSDTERKLLFVVKREKYARKGDNGVGLQMVDIDSFQSDPKEDIYWYQVSDSPVAQVLCVKWIPTLLLGSRLAGSVIIKVPHRESD